MTDMIQRVARAIFRSHFHPDEEAPIVGVKWDDWPDEQKRCTELARAAIEALRDPTEEMLEATSPALKNLIQSVPPEERTLRWGKPKEGMGYCIPHREKHCVRYQAMIDRALHPTTATRG